MQFDEDVPMRSVTLSGTPRPSGQDTVIREKYGVEPEQFGDLHLARTDAPKGSIVLVHGGFWRAHRGLEMTTPAATELAGLGWHVWNIEYRRAGQAAWQQTLLDCERACEYLAVLARTHGLVTDPALLVGHSAGGHLAAWVAGRGAGGLVDGLVTLNGVLDFGLAHELGIGDNAARSFIGADASAVDVRYCDPVRRLPLPFRAACLHSRDDERVPFDLTASYVGTSVAAGGVVDLIEVPGHHTAVIEPDSAAWPLVLASIESHCTAQ